MRRDDPTHHPDTSDGDQRPENPRQHSSIAPFICHDKWVNVPHNDAQTVMTLLLILYPPRRRPSQATSSDTAIITAFSPSSSSSFSWACSKVATHWCAIIARRPSSSRSSRSGCHRHGAPGRHAGARHGFHAHHLHHHRGVWLYNLMEKSGRSSDLKGRVQHDRSQRRPAPELLVAWCFCGCSGA